MQALDIQSFSYDDRAGLLPVLLTALAVSLINLLVDLTYGAINPRVRYG